MLRMSKPGAEVNKSSAVRVWTSATMAFIRGARPVMDLKYELTQHPAIRHTVDGGGPPYIHKGKQAPAFTGTPLFQAFSAEELNESEENAA